MSDKELREALERIRDTTLDQPAAVNVPHEEWFRRLLLDAMGIARRALDDSPDPSPERERLADALLDGFWRVGRTDTYSHPQQFTYLRDRALEAIEAAGLVLSRAASGEPSTPEEPR